MRSKLYAVKLICPRATATPRPNPQRKRHPRIVKRARIRLLAHEGIPDAEIITRVEGSESTVLNIRRRFQTEPSDDLLFEKTHPGRLPKFEWRDSSQNHCDRLHHPTARVWVVESYRLLANRVVELGFVDAIHLDTIGEIGRTTKRG